jgi:hypothetical protein
VNELVLGDASGSPLNRRKAMNQNNPENQIQACEHALQAAIAAAY